MTNERRTVLHRITCLFAGLAVIGLAVIGLAAPSGAGQTEPQSTAAETQPLRMALFGQSIIRYDLRRESPESARQMAGILADYDVVFTNFEAVMDRTDMVDGTAQPKRFGLVHRATSGAMESLSAINVNLLSLANNHSSDLGADGVFQTITSARRGGFAYSGTGANVDQASAPGYLQTPAGLVALVSMTSLVYEGGAATEETPGAFYVAFDERTQQVNEDDRQRLLASVREAARHAQIVMVYHHCHNNQPQRETVAAWRRQLTHELIDAGADLYLSHGTPVNRGIEIYQGKPILYGLSNWIFQVRRPIYYAPDVDAWRTVMASVTFEGDRLTALALTPMVSYEATIDRVFYPHGAPRLATGADATELLELIVELSKEFGTELEIVGETAELKLPN